MKDAIRSAIIGVLAVLAVAFAASILDATVTTGPTSGSGSGGDSGSLALPQSESTPREVVEIPYLLDALAILAVVLVGAIIIYRLIYWRETLRILLAIASVLGVFGLLYWLVGPPEQVMTEFGGTNGVTDGTAAGSGPTGLSPPSVLLLVVLGLGVVGAVVALFKLTTGYSTDSPEESEAGDPTATAVDRAAGRAADRLEESVSVDNEVYRTWHELTGLLDVGSPTTSTPGEIADAAIEAGLGRQDIEALTRLFEDVRYGDARPTEDREQRAIAIFRRIEQQHAGDDS
jgi:hypothetical protein